MPLKLLSLVCLVKLIMCETDILEEIADVYFPPGTITVIENKDSQRFAVFTERNYESSRSLVKIMSKEKWVLEVYSSEIERLPPTEQRKQHPHEAIIIFLSDITSIYHIIDFIRSKRIVGPNTKMVIAIYGATEGIIKKLLQLVEKRLRIWKSCLVTDANRFYELDGLDGDPVEKFISELFRRNVLPYRLNMRVLWSEDGIYVFPDNQRFNGVCIQIAKTIASSLNMTIKVNRLITEENSYRTYGLDGEFTGFLRVLHRQQADLVCGSISLFETRHYVADALPSFTQEPLRWIIATNGPIRGWKRLIYAFHQTVWITVFVTWAVSLFVLYVKHRLRKYRDFSKIAVHIVGATLEISFIKHLGGFRSFLSLFLVYSMIITSAYKSGLTSLLTLPRMETKISTVEEGLKENRMVFVLPSWEEIIESWTDFEDATTLWDVDFRGRYQILSSSLESLQKMANNQSVMTLMPEDEAESLIIKYFMNIDGLKAFTYLPERFMNYPKVICMSPGHPFYNLFAVKQLQIIEGGFIDMWFKKFYHQVLVKMIYHSTTNIFERTNSVPLAVDHLSGVFLVFEFGLLVSFFVFLGEHVVRFWNKCGK